MIPNLYIYIINIYIHNIFIYIILDRIVHPAQLTHRPQLFFELSSQSAFERDAREPLLLNRKATNSSESTSPLLRQQLTRVLPTQRFVQSVGRYLRT